MDHRDVFGRRGESRERGPGLRDRAAGGHREPASRRAGLLCGRAVRGRCRTNRRGRRDQGRRGRSGRHPRRTPDRDGDLADAGRHRDRRRNRRRRRHETRSRPARRRSGDQPGAPIDDHTVGRGGRRPGHPRVTGGDQRAGWGADGAADHQRPAGHHRRDLDPRHHRHRAALLHRVMAGLGGTGRGGRRRPAAVHGRARHRRAHREGGHRAATGAARGVLRRGRRLHRSGPAPRGRGGHDRRGLRRHGRQAHQAGRGHPDDALHPVEGLPGPARRDHRGRRWRRGAGGRGRRCQHRAPRP